MKTIESIVDMKKEQSAMHKNGFKIGFVPTMGALHSGHVSLIKASKAMCDKTVVSIFVNPLQFGPKEDLEAYPRQLEQDQAILEQEGVELLFYPSSEELYPQHFYTHMAMPDLSQTLCGSSRPGHFEGVMTVLTKLFHIVRPNKVFMGQKDIQQARIVEQMIADLNMDVHLELCATVRDSDGLALSSRNQYLTLEERKVAPYLYDSLKMAKELIESGQKETLIITNKIRQIISKSNNFKIDYVQIVDYNNLQPMSLIEGRVIVAVAAFLGTTRLIDNIVIEGNSNVSGDAKI